jgi:tetratricopeptide (TPR) repeat protein
MSDATPPLSRPVGVRAEEYLPLSESCLWQVNSGFYERSGVDAWASGEVPHLLTSGPMLARSYAAVIEGFVEDVLAGRLGSFDVDEPLYVVELGAGPGRLGFYLSRALDRAALAPMRVVYVLTDLAEKNLEFWAHHPRLAPLIERGELDLARYDAGEDEDLHLEISGRTLRPGSVRNPVVACANYLFDVLPQDLFHLEHGVISEELVAACSIEPAVVPGEDDFLDRLFLSTSRVPLRPARYGGALAERVLHELAGDRSGRVLLPSVGLGVLDRLLALSEGRLALLFGERPGQVPDEPPDAGVVAELAGTIPELPAGPGSLLVEGREALRPGALLAMGIHGRSFSLPVDLDALSRPVRDLGGALLTPEALPAGLIVGALLADEGRAESARRAYAHTINELGPEDLYLTIRAALDNDGEGVNLAMLLAVLRVGAYDPYLLRRVYRSLERELVDAAEEGLDETVRVLERIADNDFPLDGDTDLAYGIAVLLAPPGRYADALRFFEASRHLHGPRGAGLFNEALCHLHLEQPEEALALLEAAIALPGGHPPASELREQLLTERQRTAEAP